MVTLAASLNALSDRLDKVMRLIGVIFLMIIVMSSFLQVFTRYVLNSSLFWTEECARFAFIWATMFGAAVGVKSKSHAAVDFLVSRLRGKARNINLLSVDIMILIMGVLLIYAGCEMLTLVHKQLSPALRIPMSYVYGGIPVGAVGIVVHALTNIVNTVAPLETCADGCRE
ncbi:TRAP transporter small permease protein [Deltaproteobacteria bacterium]|nr:TRAP transporter small permease protein [Deltaproteobacteria bacterium]